MIRLHSDIFLYSKIIYIIYIAKMNYSPQKETTIQLSEEAAQYCCLCLVFNLAVKSWASQSSAISSVPN